MKIIVKVIRFAIIAKIENKKKNEIKKIKTEQTNNNRIAVFDEL